MLLCGLSIARRRLIGVKDYIHIFVSIYPRPAARAYDAAALLIEGVVLSGV
jgi:hypothetical protein